MTVAPENPHPDVMISPLTIALLGALIGSSEPAFTTKVQAEQPAQTMQDLRLAHIAANVPVGDDFEAFLVRDLTAYFAEHFLPASVVTYELLRDGPTQSGVAYPKYYVWAKATASDGTVLEGAARVAAIERTRFEVTDFVSRQQIVSQPDSLDQVVPAALFELTVERARRP